LTETGLLTLAGAALGLALARWSLSALPWIGVTDLPRASEIRMDAVVVLFTIGLALALGLIVGVVPSLQLNGLNLNSVLREEGRSGTAGRSSGKTRRTLVVAQVALAFVLLCGAGLLLASFQQLLAVDPGFKSDRVLTGRLMLPEARFSLAALGPFVDRALASVRALPGVDAAGVTSTLPLTGSTFNSVILAEGHVMSPGESVVSPAQLRVAPGYFEVMRIPLRRGRFFTASDTANAPRVVVVDQALARRFWPGDDPIGRRMYLPGEPSDVVKPGPKVTWMQVVGVVGTVKMAGLNDNDATAVGAYYFPYAQDPTRTISIAVRTSGDGVAVATSVRRVLSALDPEIAFYDVVSMPDRVERSLERRRTPMLLSVAFGGVALLLAAIGLYGTLAYQVAQRTREIGIRMALGSDATGVLRLVLREGLGLLAVGLVVGLMGAYALQYVIASELYGITAFDPAVILAVMGVLGLTSLVACVGPALRAARVNPVEALSL
jgi:predicted permease